VTGVQTCALPIYFGRIFVPIGKLICLYYNSKTGMKC
jgi:hypothetical protein